MKTLVVLSMTLMTFSAARSQNAGNWPLNSNLNGTAAASLSVSAISLGSSIPTSAFNGGSEWYGEGGWPSTSTVDPNAYVEFSLTASAGHYLVLNTVTLIQRRSNTGSPQGAGPTSYSLRSSLDNYTADIATGSITYNYATYTINLPAAYQAIPSKVTFRIYGYNTTVNPGGSSRMVFDNISVQGQSVSGVLASQSISLSARADESKQVILQWDALGFDAGTQFTIERSTNAAGFASIYHTNTADQYTDVTAPSGAVLYYRIQAALPDGSHYISPVVSVRNENGRGTAIRAVIAQGGNVRTLLHLTSPGACQLSIWSQDGKPLARQVVSGEGDIESDMAFSYPHGVYILTIAGVDGNSSRKFVF
ncbi:MAG TPA: hypothetical protein VHD83_27225 [Puia sp.]|nr:hypothetical protein [Puia sp.]